MLSAWALLAAPQAALATSNGAISVTPNKLNFGAVDIGSYGKKTVTIAETSGANAILINGQSYTGSGKADFSGTACNIGLGLPASETCTFDVKFSPTAVGESSATVTIHYSALIVVNDHVTLTGIGDHFPTAPELMSPTRFHNSVHNAPSLGQDDT